jgi:hypothetical protein
MKHYIALRDGRPIGHLYTKNIRAAIEALIQLNIVAIAVLAYRVPLKDRLLDLPVLAGEKLAPLQATKKPVAGVRRCVTITNLPPLIAIHFDSQPVPAKYVKKLIIKDYNDQLNA